MKRFLPVFLVTLTMVFSGCMSDSQFKDKMKKSLKENPEILTEAIEAKPAEFVEALQKAMMKAREEMAKKQEQDEQKKLDDAYNNPLQPEIRSDEGILGPKDAPITLVEYSDFECPFCKRGHATTKEIMKAYPGKVRLIFKHLPLAFHNHALMAAKYFEAIRIQDAQKAYKYHDFVFENQQGLQGGEKFLQDMAKKAGADMNKLKKDLNSDAVTARIEADKAEAAKFGIEGTPGFIINGVPVKGAYPVEHFKKIVEELKKRGKLNI